MKRDYVEQTDEHGSYFVIGRAHMIELRAYHVFDPTPIMTIRSFCRSCNVVLFTTEYDVSETEGLDLMAQALIDANAEEDGLFCLQHLETLHGF